MTKRRVVVTGLGMISPLGVGNAPTWQGLVDGRSGIGQITKFDATDYACRIAGEIRDFNAEDYIEKKEVKKSDTFIHYAVAAATMAAEDAGFDSAKEDQDRVGVIIGSGIGGLPLIEEMHKKLIERGPSRISPFFIPGLIVNLAAGHISIRFGCKGPSSAPATACATGAHAIGDAAKIIRYDEADVMFAGGSEAVITSLAVGGFAAMRALSTRNDEPQRASRPWDAQRDGFVMGEGAGVLILEEREHALARGATIYCELTGYGMSSDAFHITSPAEDGSGMARVMARALKDAGLQPTDINYINAHGTSTPVGDQHRDRRHQDRLRRRRVQDSGELDQVHDRSPPRRRRRPGVGDCGDDDQDGDHPADDQLREPRSGVRSRLRAEHGPEGREHHARAVELVRLRRDERDADFLETRVVSGL